MESSGRLGLVSSGGLYLCIYVFALDMEQELELNSDINSDLNLKWNMNSNVDLNLWLQLFYLYIYVHKLYQTVWTLKRGNEN